MLARLRQYRFNWKLSLFTVLMLPVLIRLGFWQLQREDEKLALQAVYDSRQGAEAVSLASLSPDDDLQYMPVHLEGQFDNAHTFLLDNKIYQGQAGYEVLSPFSTENGELAIVNRGWIAQNAYRDILPEVDAVPGRVELQGSVYVPVGEQFMLGDEVNMTGWPKVIQSIDTSYMASALNLESGLFPYTVRLAPSMPGVFVRNWPVITTTPERHRGYAIQWFTMASVLFLLYVFFSTRKVESGEQDIEQE